MLPSNPNNTTTLDVPEEERLIPLGEQEPTRAIELDVLSEVNGTMHDKDIKKNVQKAHFALGGVSPGIQFMEVDFAQGLERETRRLAAMNEALQFRQVKIGMVQDLSKAVQAEGRNFSPEEAELVMGLSVEDFIDPETILERLFAEKLVRTGVSTDDPEIDPTLINAMIEDEEAAQAVLDKGEETVTNQEIALRIRAHAKKKYDDASWWRWGVDAGATTLFPLVQWSNVTDVVESLPEGSTLTGDNVRETLVRLHSLPPAEFKREATKMIDEMMEDNIIDAMFMAEALVGYTNIDQQWDNDMFRFDVADIVSLGALPVAKGVMRLARRVRSISRVNSGDITIQDGLAAAGNLEQAAVEGAARLIDDAANPQARVLDHVTELGKHVFGMNDANLLARNAGSLSVNRVNRIVEHIQNNRKALMEIVTDSSVLQRYGAQAGDLAFEFTKRDWLRDYSKLEDAIVEVVPIRESEHIFGGVDRIDVYLGRQDGTSFVDETVADWYARNHFRLAKDSYKVVFKDGNYLLRMSKHVDENRTEILDLRAKTESPETQTYITDFIRHLGLPLDKILPELASPDDIISAGHREARNIATFGGNRVAGLMSDTAKSIGDIPKASKRRLQTVLEKNHFETQEITLPDGTKNTVSGIRYKTLGEIEQGWVKHTGQMPTDKEIQAYITFQDIMDTQWRLNNLAKYRDKARLGIEQKSISFLQEVDGQQMRMHSPFFEGRSIDKLPHWGQQPFTVMYVDKKGAAKVRLSSKMFPGEKKYIEELLSSGNHRVIQTLSGGGDLRKAVKSGGEPIEYVIAKDVRTRPLDLVQIAHREGGHRRHADHGAYLKQPNVTYTSAGRVIRNGDTTAHWDPSVKQMEKYGEAYETARRMAKDGVDDTVLGRYLHDNLPIYRSAREFKRHFRGIKGSPKDAPFDINSPFVVVRSRQSSGEKVDLASHYGREFVDYGDSEHNLAAKLGSYDDSERSEILTRIREEGTESNPVFKLEPAQILDPLSALERAGQQLMRSRYFEDYKHMAVETWARNAAKYLDATPQEITANPMKHLVDPKWKATPDFAMPRLLKAQRRAIMQLMGAEQKSWGSINNAFQKVADGFNAARGKPSDPIVDAWRWTDPQLSPGQWARSTAFHAWLGLWNVKQLLLQGSATMHMAAITGNPIRAAQSVQAYMMMRRLLLSSDNQISGASRMLRKATGLDEKVFQEMYDTYRRAGLHEFKGENAMIDMYFKPRIIDNKGQKVLQAGQFFFREGNMLSRGSSYAAAFLEFRAKNPLKKITDRDLASIVQRADIMSVNQTRASINPIYEQGALKFPTQFFTFFSRLSDQMLGQRLTGMEKARIMGVYSTLYGVPTGTAGVALGRFWPFYEQAKEDAHRQGVNLDEHPIFRFYLEGGLPIAMEAFTGEKFEATGSWGPGGLPWLRDIIRGNTNTLELLAGASGAFYGELIRASSPFVMAMSDLFSPAGTEQQTFKIKDEDFLRVIRSVSSINAGVGVFLAYNRQMSFSRNNQETFETDVPTAIVTGLTGWQQKRVADAWSMMEDGKHYEKMKREAVNMALQEFKKGIWALYNDDDQESYDDYSHRAFYILQGAGLNAKDAADVLKRAMKDNANIVESIENDYKFKGPADQYQARRKKNYNDIEDRFIENERQRLEEGTQ